MSERTVKLMTRAEVAEALQVCDRTIKNWVANGEIPFVRIGKTVRFNLDDIMEAKSFRPQSKF